MNITIRVEDLAQLVADLKEDKVEAVQLSYLEGTELDGESIPPSLGAKGFSPAMGGYIDYPDIDALEDEGDDC